MFKLCIFAGLIEGALVILALLSPTIRQFFLDIMIKRAGKDVYARILEANGYYRAFGFADTLLDTFGYGMGLLAGMCLFYEPKSLKIYISLAVFILSTAVNSRTGLLVFILALLIHVFYEFRWKYLHAKKLLKGVILVLIFVALVVYIINNPLIIKSPTISWITAGFESLLDFLMRKRMVYRLGSMQNSFFSKRFWAMPDELTGLFFGEGHSVFGTMNILGVASDVGYINYIWICGMLGLVILLLCALNLFIHSYRLSYTDYEKKVVLLIAISFFAVFAKGNIISHTAGTFISIFCCLTTKIPNDWRSEAVVISRIFPIEPHS